MRRILWFRRDLRVEDNALLSFGGNVLPIFIFDENILKELAENDKRVGLIFLHVEKLKENLREVGLDLAIFYGKPDDVFRYILGQTRIDEVCASGDYDSYAKQRDIEVSRLVDFNMLHETYIFKPDEVLKDDGSPYLVFTPFYNRAKTLFGSSHTLASEIKSSSLIRFEYSKIHQIKDSKATLLNVDINQIGFVKSQSGIEDVQTLLERFKTNIKEYKQNRDFISTCYTSGLSVHLRFGTIGIKRLLRWLDERKKDGIDTEPFLRQLIFREYYAYLLYHFPQASTKNFKYNFYGLQNSAYFEAFINAKTGVPIVDAGVNELLQTGVMHNRVRMICASFFTKDLLLPWQSGERFFASHLLDYDAASNIFSWQWSAGTGVDPQPYFRIFNPYLQSKKFDNDAIYIKRWLPQLHDVEPKNIHDEQFLLSATIEGYPRPIIVHKEAKERVLNYYKKSVI